MAYSYQEERPKLLTEHGVRVLLGVRDRANELLAESGVATLGKIIEGGSKFAGAYESFTALAAVEFLEEIGELECISMVGASQDHVYRKGGRRG